ncbi:MAG TPA: hypothetical protein VHP58_01855 [Alphaproteobacteria bacterium]|nr:hypothetical protein [Alphaproteobacteria bacterium]
MKARRDAGITIKDMFDQAVATATKNRQPATFRWDNLTCTVEEGANWEDFHGPFDLINYAGRDREVPGNNFTITYAQPAKQQAA